jgi:predicted nucleotidyltransferase
MDGLSLERELARLLADAPDLRAEICLVYLFGSQVNGPTGPLSDYDLGVLVRRGADQEAILVELSRRLAQAMQTERIDVVSLRGAPVELAYAVIAQGKRLYEHDVETRVEYEAQVLSLYGDYRGVLDAQRQDILQGDEHGRRVQRYRAALGRTRRTLGEIRAAAEPTTRSV